MRSNLLYMFMIYMFKLKILKFEPLLCEIQNKYFFMKTKHTIFCVDQHIFHSFYSFTFMHAQRCIYWSMQTRMIYRPVKRTSCYHHFRTCTYFKMYFYILHIPNHNYQTSFRRKPQSLQSSYTCKYTKHSRLQSCDLGCTLDGSKC